MGTSLSITELKALAYDTIAQIQQAQNKLDQINAEIQKVFSAGLAAAKQSGELTPPPPPTLTAVPDAIEEVMPVTTEETKYVAQ